MSGPYEIAVISSSSYAAVYGPKKQFQDRWNKEDNIIALSPSFKKVAVYILHGRRDEEVPIDHSQLLALRLALLKKQNPQSFIYKYAERNKSHGWNFWNGEMEDFFIFADQQMRK